MEKKCRHSLEQKSLKSNPWSDRSCDNASLTDGNIFSLNRDLQGCLAKESDTQSSQFWSSSSRSDEPESLSVSSSLLGMWEGCRRWRLGLIVSDVSTSQTWTSSKSSPIEMAWSRLGRRSTNQTHVSRRPLSALWRNVAVSQTVVSRYNSLVHIVRQTVTSLRLRDFAALCQLNSEQ